MADLAADFASALQDLLALLHQVALAQTIPGFTPDGAYDAGRIRELAGQLAPEDVQLFYQIGLAGQKDLPLAPDPRSGFEMVLLRMLAFRPAQAGGAPGGARQGPAQASAQPEERQQTASHTSTGPAAEPAGMPDAPPPAAAPDPSRWELFAKALKLGGIASQLANNCVFDSWDGETLNLTLDPARQQLRVGQAEKRLQDGIRKLLGDRVKLQITAESSELETPAQRQAREQQERQREAEQVMANDPLVREMEEHFDARLVPGSVKPVA